MGLSLTAEYKDAPDYSMGYGSFFCLRRDIAYTISKEFGDAYADIVWGSLHPEEYDRRITALLKKYHVKKRLEDFLFASDCNAKMSPMKCKAIYEQIKGVQSTTKYGYAYSKMSMDQFRELLRQCFERKCYMYWS